MKSRIIGTAMVLIGLVIALVGFSAPAASAHVGTVNVTCTSVSVALSNYNTSKGPNHVSVTINGKTKVDANFSQTFNQTFNTNGKGFSWQVVVHASDDQRFSFTKSGDQAACPTKPCPTVTVTHIETVPGPTVTKTATVTVTQTVPVTTTVTASPVTSTVTTTAPGSVVTLPGRTKTESVLKVLRITATNGTTSTSTQTFSSAKVAALPRTGSNILPAVNLAGWLLVIGGVLTLFGKGFRLTRRH